MSKKTRISIIRDRIAKVTRILSGKGMRVTQSGMNAFVEYDDQTLEPIRVNIPYLADDASDSLIAAIEGFVDHEVGHLLFSDAKAIEKSAALKVQSLHNIIEDVYIERKMSREFTGTAYNLSKMYDIFTHKFIEPKYEKIIKRSDAKEIDFWHLLCACACRAIGGQEHFIEYMSDKWVFLPKISKVLEPFKTRIATSSDSWENIDIAVDIKAAIYGTKEEPKEEPEKSEPLFEDEEADKEDGEEEIEDEEFDEADEEIEDEEIEDEEAEEEIEDEEIEDEEAEEEIEDEEAEDEEAEEADDKGKGESIGEDETPDAPADDGEEDGSIHGEIAAGDGESSTAPFADEDSESSMEHYSEFDDGLSELINEMSGEDCLGSKYIPFTKDVDRVETFPVPSSFDPKLITELEHKVSGMTGMIQKGLERAFKAANKSRWESGKKTGRVNSASLSRLLNNDPRVFRTREEIKTKEVAVSIVIDCSGSMSGSRIQVATETAWALSDVLSKLGINYEVLGFTTADEFWGSTESGTDMLREMREDGLKRGFGWSRTEPIYIPIFKSFDERWGVEQRKRVASIPRHMRLANNVDGESIEYAAARLLRQPQPGKTMIVLSDGAPCALGSSSSAFSDHLKEVVKDIERKKVNMVGIGIQTKAVCNYYRKNVVINRLEELPTIAMTQLRDAIMAK